MRRFLVWLIVLAIAGAAVFWFLTIPRGLSDAELTSLPAGNVLGPALNAYAPPSNLTSLQPGTVTNVGGSQAHLNMQPFLTLSFCIALQGIFPSPT